MSSRYPEMIAAAPSKREEVFDFPSSHTVGYAAGRIWNYLDRNGETSILKLKAEVQCSATVVHLSLGWLLREDKIKLTGKNGHLKVQLR